VAALTDEFCKGAPLRSTIRLERLSIHRVDLGARDGDAPASGSVEEAALLQALRGGARLD
jgi:hypothetical protein